MLARSSAAASAASTGSEIAPGLPSDCPSDVTIGDDCERRSLAFCGRSGVARACVETSDFLQVFWKCPGTWVSLVSAHAAEAREPMAENELIAGLDLGTTKVCAIVGEQVEDGIDIIGIGCVPSKGLKKGVVVNIESTVQAIRAAIDQAE